MFCGVEFMGKGNFKSRKTVIMVDVEADCPMAHMEI
ncbi:MAG: hypothetical protein ACLR13_02460 [Acutalibacteraceae bacterium]